MIRQKTLKNAIRATGVGLHTGERVFVTVRPAPANAGISFVRTDLDPRVSIRAHVDNVVETRLATTLGVGDASVSTVEHLMAAFSGLEIDNAIVEVSAAEMPIMDGSAAPFVFLLQSAGIVEQDEPRLFLRVLSRVEVSRGDAAAQLQPHDGCRIDYTLEYDHPVFRNHSHHASVELTSTAFIKDVSRARTFGFLADYDRLRAQNLARGGSLDNAVVVDDAHMNREGLRIEDEFVKHKILDAVGDLYLLGHPLIGRFTGYKSGHSANNALLRRLLAETGSYELVTASIGPDIPRESLQPAIG
ncbi:MAG: UDP-3-O-acyl-N-acetylglucosamine deacetylase [Gammaproteobacteria bacterium]|nr:UDP-3-O-acyl-N-acetylglucosamine deacetylase [Gammaproteobacteria bacterium]